MPCNHDVDDIAALVNAVIDGFQIRPYKKRGFLVVQQGSPMGGDLLMSCLDPPKINLVPVGAVHKWGTPIYGWFINGKKSNFEVDKSG